MLGNNTQETQGIKFTGVHVEAALHRKLEEIIDRAPGRGAFDARLHEYPVRVYGLKKGSSKVIP